MTPNQLLESVKLRFTTLLHDEQPALEALLKKALTAYQDKAGVIKRVRFKQYQEVFELPADFLARVKVSDQAGDFIGSTVWPAEGEIELNLRGDETYPITLMYLSNLASADIDTYVIPETAVGTISDYLEALIAIPNAKRERRVAAAGKLDISDIPTETDLEGRKTELELKMAQNRAIVPPMSVRG
jgi:hypothetical protein